MLTCKRCGCEVIKKWKEVDTEFVITVECVSRCFSWLKVETEFSHLRYIENIITSAIKSGPLKDKVQYELK